MAIIEFEHVTKEFGLGQLATGEEVAGQARQPTAAG